MRTSSHRHTTVQFTFRLRNGSCILNAAHLKQQRRRHCMVIGHLGETTQFTCRAAVHHQVLSTRISLEFLFHRAQPFLSTSTRVQSVNYPSGKACKTTCFSPRCLPFVDPSIQISFVTVYPTRNHLLLCEFDLFQRVKKKQSVIDVF